MPESFRAIQLGSTGFILFWGLRGALEGREEERGLLFWASTQRQAFNRQATNDDDRAIKS